MPIDLTAKQQSVILSIVEGIKKHKLPVQTMGGYAGTGKTLLVTYLLDVLENYAVCAFTGKAANVLRQKGAFNAQTIHSLIYKPFAEPDGSVSFRLTDDIGCEGIIVDEASMVTPELDADLRSFGLPILYVGDHGQLPPVGNDFNLMADPMYRLEEIHRNAGPIAEFCQWIRLGKSARAFPAERAKGKIKFIRKWDVTPELLASVDQTICAYNKTRVALNIKVRDYLGYKDILHEGEKVMCLRNSRKLGVFNGMQGRVVDFYKEKRTHYLDFESNDDFYPRIPYDPKQFNQEKTVTEYVKDGPLPFDYAPVITAHKCVHPDTLVETKEGLLPIKKIAAEGVIATPYGPRRYRNFVRYEDSPCLKFSSKQGYSLTVTTNHKMDVWSDGEFVLKEASDINLGDRMRLKLGVTVEPDSDVALPIEPVVYHNATLYNLPTFSEDFAEFLGLMVADGTIWKSGFRLVKRHIEVVERFGNLVRKLFGYEPIKIFFGKTPGYEVHSTFLASWLGEIDGLLPHHKDIPECILRSNSNIHAKFLRGLFEDGGAQMGRDGFLDHIEWSSSMPQMVAKVKTMLLRLGIVSESCKDRTESDIFIYGNYAKKFSDHIGFISKFKQDRLLKFKETDRYSKIPFSREESKCLRKIKHPLWSQFSHQNTCASGHMNRLVAIALLDSESLPVDIRDKLLDRIGYHHVTVDSIEQLTGPSMCLEVPDGHRFLQNGFPHGNSQGDQWNRVLIYEEVCRAWDHIRWLYTCGSRACEEVTLALA